MHDEPQNILVVHIAGLGQTVLALPALRSLRRHLPQAHITVVSSTAAADLLRIAGCADEVMAVGRLRGMEGFAPNAFFRSVKTGGELRDSGYDLAIEMKASTEAGILIQMAQPRRRLSPQSNSLSRGLRQVIERIAESLTKQPQPFKHAA